MDWSTETRNSSLLGGEQGRCHGACVPRSAVCPRMPPGRPSSFYKSWWPLGTQPGWYERVHSQCVVAVIFCEPPYLAVWCVGRGTALPWSRTGSGVPQGRTPPGHSGQWWAPSSDPWPRTQMCCAGLWQCTCQPHVVCVPAAYPACSQSPGCPAPWSLLVE